MEVSGQHHASATLYKGKNHGTHWIGGGVGPKNSPDVVRQRKISTTAGIRTPDRPARSLITIPTTISRLQNW